MTKRGLIKWMENRAQEARIEASKRKTELIKAAEEEVYNKLGVYEFVEEVVPIYSELLEKYNAFVESIESNEDCGISRYYHEFGYTNLITKYSDSTKFSQIVRDTIRINSSHYKEVVQVASEEFRKVVSTYDTVLLTLHNLPSAKEGLEYLKKLGFDISQIQVEKAEKQLPATASVNVDTKYLLLKK